MRYWMFKGKLDYLWNLARSRLLLPEQACHTWTSEDRTCIKLEEDMAINENGKEVLHTLNLCPVICIFRINLANHK